MNTHTHTNTWTFLMATTDSRVAKTGDLVVFFIFNFCKIGFLMSTKKSICLKKQNILNKRFFT